MLQNHKKRVTQRKEDVFPVIRTVKKEKSPVKDDEKVQVYYFPYDRDTKIYQFTFLEDIPTTREDFRKQEKEWLGFEKALYKIGLNKDEVLDRI